VTRPSGPQVAPADAAAILEIRSLGRQGAPAKERLIEALATPSWVVRRAVIEELSGLGREAAETMCQSLRSDRRGESRLSALVDALVASSASLDDLLFSLLDDQNPAVVCDGLQIIGRRGTAAAAVRAVELSGHADDNVAVASIEALGSLGGTEALACLLGLVRSDSFFRSFAAIDMLGRLGDARAVEPLLAVIDDPLRGPEAVRALGRLGDETAVGELLGWLASSQVNNARVAAVALAEIHERLKRRYGTSLALRRALSRHPQKDVLEARLERALAGADAAEKVAIGSLLGLFSSNASVESLFVLLREPGDAATVAARSLGTLAKLGNPEVLASAFQLSSDQRALLLPELCGLSAAVPWFVQCLTDPETRVRVLACDALAKTGDPSCVSALFSLLGNADLLLNQAVTAALQSLGSPETETLALAAVVTGPPARRHAALRIVSYFGSRRALPVLLEAAAGDDERSREIALLGLASIEAEDALTGLLAASRHASPKTRAAAARALGTVAPSAEVVTHLLEATTDPDAWVRYYACQSLGSTGDPKATETLSARLLDPAGQVRVAAIDAIARLPGAPALAVLERAAQHEDLEVRRAALTGLGLTRQPSSLPLLFAAATSPDTATRLMAISSLSKYDAPEALARVFEVARTDADPSVQGAAIELLSEVASAASTTALVELLSVEAQRANAVGALARHAAKRAKQLLAVLEHASAEVSDAIVEVFVRLPAPDAETWLLSALSSENEHARRAAVRALRAAFDDERVRLALARSASRDADPEVRRIAAARLS
jgi:HEAT repeat protein